MKTKTNSLPTRKTFATAALMLGAFTFLLDVSPLPACGTYTSELDLEKLAVLAISENPPEASRATIALRAKGAEGLQAFLSVHAEEIQRHLASPPVPPGASNSGVADWERLSQALDRIGGQRDCFASRLYWHTDLETARAAARASGKPILSLRLLGRLDEEFSCANSRFFRTALYANTEVSAAMRERFILHWQSVRPVPKITIDFGDGRKLERTLTGNSIHYVLDAEGRPIDALPGLYGPKAFLRGLTRAEQAARHFASLPPTEREEFLRVYHQDRLAALTAEWNIDLAKAANDKDAHTTAALTSAVNHPPTARTAAKAAVGKRQVELPVLESMASLPALDAKILEAKMDDAAWVKLGALHAEDARLDQGSRLLMAKKNPNALAAGKLALSKMLVETPLIRAARQFERSMAEDTVRNEYLIHLKIHEWFAQGLPQLNEVEVLNEKVYAELFLTPSSDPWLGLKPADTYSALEKDGIVGPAGL
jgi:hypothetical protein